MRRTPWVGRCAKEAKRAFQATALPLHARLIEQSEPRSRLAVRVVPAVELVAEFVGQLADLVLS